MRTVPHARVILLTSLRVLLTAALLPLALPLFADNDEDGYRLLELDGYLVKWGELRLGVGASISYVFARELYGPAIDSETLAIGSDSPLIDTPAAGKPTVN